VSALASEPLELAAPVQGPTRARRERLRLVPPLRPQLAGISRLQELLDTWSSTLACADHALETAASMKVYSPDALRACRHRLRDERRWLMREVEMQAFGPSTSIASSREDDRMMTEQKHFTAAEARRVGEQIGINWESAPFDVEQFRMGMDVELEHGLHDPATNVTGDDPIVTGKIALAHLNEFPDYYTRLDRMETEANQAAGRGRRATRWPLNFTTR
jgi:hypothetical protein